MDNDDSHFRKDLCRLRGELTRLRREQAEQNDIEGVLATQQGIELLDEAIEDEGRIYNKEHRPFMAFI